MDTHDMTLSPESRPAKPGHPNRHWAWLLMLAALAMGSLLKPAGARAQGHFLGEIIATPYNFAPSGCMFCAGQILPITQYTALFSLLGTTYGGDGKTTFALPDLRGRIGLETGQGPGLSSYDLGETGGEEFHKLTLAEMPVHTHGAVADSSPGTGDGPAGLLPAQNAAGMVEYGRTPSVAMHAAAVGMTGGGQDHENRPPFLALNYVITTVGIFPARSAPTAPPQRAARKVTPSATRK